MKLRLPEKGVVFLLCFISILSLLFVGCEENEISAVGIHPESENLGLYTTDTLTLIAYTDSAKAVRTDNLSLTLLGRINDQIFGESEASFAAQVLPESANTNFGSLSGLIVDSVVLSMVYSNGYGPVSPMSFEVYALSEVLNVQSTYYSNHQAEHEAMVIGSISDHSPNMIDSVVVGGEKRASQLRINLNSDLGVKLLVDGPDYFNNPESFTAFFPGIYVKESSTLAAGSGMVLYFDMMNTASGIEVFYRTLNGNTPEGMDTGAYMFNFTPEVKRYSMFEHNYDQTAFVNVMGDESYFSSDLYIQAMAGLVTKVKIPYLNNILSMGPVAVHKAEFVFNLEQEEGTDYPPFQQVFIDGLGEDDTFFPLPFDLIEGENYYGGKFDSINNTYKVNVARHFQFMMNDLYGGSENNTGFVLRGGFGSISANRMVINNTDHPTRGLKLILSYTPIN